MQDLPVNSQILYWDSKRAVLNKPGYMDYLSFKDTLPALFRENMASFTGQAVDQAIDSVPLPEDPSPVHRLDKYTSGCLVVGFTSSERRRLSKLFADRGVEKTYFAIVEGQFSENVGTIAAPIAYDKRINHSRVCDEGKPALTEYAVLACGETCSLVLLKPHTGRTHQLRVHMAHKGHPIRGDMRYGDAGPGFMHLHAGRIRFPLPGGSPLDIRAPLPPYMRETMLREFDPLACNLA